MNRCEESAGRSAEGGLRTRMETSHQDALLDRHRCCACAEPVPFRILVAGGGCPHCAAPVRHERIGGADAVLERIDAGWRRWRYPVYGGLAAVTLFASILPLAAPVAFAVTMIAAQFLLVRRPIRLLGPYRRVATRLTLKLLLALLTTLDLVVSVVVFPLFGVAQAVAAALSVVLAWVYLEGALALLRNRLRREATSPRLDTWEWALPASFMGVLLVSAAALVLAVGGVVYVLLEAEIPGLEALVEFLGRRVGT